MAILASNARLQPTHRPRRRLAIALTIALVVTGGLSVAAVAVPASTSISPTLPEYLDIPAPHLGDRVAYQESFDGLGDAPEGWLGDQWKNAPAAPHPIAAFEWRQGQPMANRDGTVFHTDRLEFTSWSYFPGFVNVSNTTFWFETESHELIAQTMNFQASAENEGDLPVLPTRTSNQAEFDINYGQDYPYPVCWHPVSEVPFLHAAQGRRLMTDSDLTGVPPWCDEGMEAVLSSFHAAAVEEVRGVRAVRWETEQGSPRGQQRVWLAPGIAYPLKMDWTFPDAPLFRRTIELTGFVPGTDPFGAPAAGVPAPPLTFAPRKPWGLDDTGVIHPFPLSTAFTMAQTSSTFPDLREFQSAYPNAYTGHADYQESVNSYIQGTTVREWRFTLTDGGHFLDVKVNQTISSLLGSPLPGPWGGAQYHVVRDAPGWRPWGPLHAPRPDEVEGELPTVASLMERWPLHADPNWPAPTGWGFSVLCGSNCAAPTQAYVGTTSSRSVASLADPQAGTFQSRNFTEIARALVFHGSDGWDAWQLANREFGSSYSSSLAPAGVHSPSDSPVPAAGPLAAPRNVGFWPSPGQAAGITLVGILAGVLYYMWPAMKGGAIGLFSRLRPDRVRDHPQRAKILLAIEGEPGIHFSGLRRKTELPNGTLVHHLQALVKAGAVAERPLGGYTCYFVGQPSRKEVATAPAFKAEGARRVFDAIRGSPGLSNAAIAQVTGMAASSVHAHVQRLVQAGLVEAVRDGRLVRLRAVAAAGAS